MKISYLSDWNIVATQGTKTKHRGIQDASQLRRQDKEKKLRELQNFKRMGKNLEWD